MKTFKQHLVEYKETTNDRWLLSGNNDFIMFEVDLTWKEIGVKENEFDLFFAGRSPKNMEFMLAFNIDKNDVEVRKYTDGTKEIKQQNSLSKGIVEMDKRGQNKAIDKGLKIMADFLRTKKIKVEYPKSLKTGAGYTSNRWKNQDHMAIWYPTDNKKQILNNAKIRFKVGILGPPEFVRFLKPYSGDLIRFAEKKL